MSITASGVHVEAGNRYFKRQQWREALEAYDLALKMPDPDSSLDAKIRRACALRFTDASTADKLAGFAASRHAGRDDPQFWPICIRYYLHASAKRDLGVASDRRDERFFDGLHRDALADLDYGIEQFRSMAATGNRLTFPWALTLIRLADWMDAYIHPRRHETGTEMHPFRSHSLRLYAVVLETDISALFGSHETWIRGEIEREITGRARSQLTARLQPGEKAAQPLSGWLRIPGGRTAMPGVGIVVAIVVAMLVIKLFAGSAVVTTALDLTVSAAGLG